MSALMIDVKVDEVLQVGDARIRIAKKSGQVARLEITAPQEMKITNLSKCAAQKAVQQNS